MTLIATIAPTTARNLLIALIGGGYLAYRLFHWWRWWQAGRSKVMEKGEGEQRNLPTGSEGAVGAVGRAFHRPPQWEGGIAENTGGPEVRPYPHAAQQEESIHSSPLPSTSTTSALSGEELYAQARAIPHQPIPNVEQDGEYLELLARSAAKDYPRALAKLGDYAMRRGCNVEAYYWLWRAKRSGMRNLDRVLLQVRSAWADTGFDREIENEYEYFTQEQGAVGYARLCIDARHNANALQLERGWETGKGRTESGLGRIGGGVSAAKTGWGELGN